MLQHLPGLGLGVSRSELRGKGQKAVQALQRSGSNLEPTLHLQRLAERRCHKIHCAGTCKAESPRRDQFLKKKFIASCKPIRKVELRAAAATPCILN